MNPIAETSQRLLGLSAYVKIYDQLGHNIELVKDSHKGYLYKGTITGMVIFENGCSETHYSILLDKAVLVHEGGKRYETMQILVTPRHVGCGMGKLLEGHELVVSFSHVKGVSFSGSSASNVTRIKKSRFKTKDFVWIGIGELSIKLPQNPYVEAPWEMHISHD